MKKILLLFLTCTLLFSCEDAFHPRRSKEYKEVVSRKYLYSIQNGNSISGQMHTHMFLIGTLSGSVDAESFIYAYIQKQDGSIVLEKYPYSKSEIRIIGDNKKPYMEKYRTCKNDTTTCFGVVKKYKTEDEGWSTNDDYCYIEYRYCFYVPENAMMTTTDLNLSNLK